MPIKDYFSRHSKVYAAFRPTYPDALYDFLFRHIRNFGQAWDCATGNGQVARVLATKFKNVIATDISAQQISEGFQAANISYSVSKAEHTDFADKQFDLITVGQALHWFDQTEFYKEVKRTLKDDGIVAVWGYAMLSVNPEVDKIFKNFYFNIVGPYWDRARKLVENEYKSISFPFREISTPQFSIQADWTIDHFIGYLTSWSATQKYIRENNRDPIELIINDIRAIWHSGEVKRVTFPVFMRLGTPAI